MKKVLAIVLTVVMAFSALPMMVFATEDEAACEHTTTETVSAKAPTCTETGLTEGTVCSDCRATIKAQEIVSAKGHEYVDTVVAPTCTEQGYTLHTCHCGDEYKDTYVKALGHKVVVDEAVDPTCTEPGKTEGMHCSECEEVLKEQETIDALGHVYGEWKVVVEAKPGSEGLAERVCAVCENVEERVIPAEAYVITIKQPSRVQINFLYGIILHYELNGDIPEGAKVQWSKKDKDNEDNDNFETEALEDGTLKMIARKNGSTTVTVSLIDADGFVLATAEQEMYSKVGIWEIICGYVLSFFNLIQVYKN